MKDLVKFWPIVVFIAGMLFGGFRIGVSTSAAIQKHLDDDERRDEHIRVLERVVVSEFPAYSAMVYYKEK